MPPMPTINLMRPIAAVYTVPDAQVRSAEGTGRIEPAAANPQSALRNSQSEHQSREPSPRTEELARLLATVNGITDSLHKLHEQTVASRPAEIAKLAVEIARKTLRHKVSKGDYEIQAIVEDALKESPTRQNIVVHLNPEDVAPCQELQRQNPQSPFARLEFTADRSIGRGECLVETPKGIVKSFIDEHLERISEALQKVQ